jgi:hypothetical protein
MPAGRPVPVREAFGDLGVLAHVSKGQQTIRRAGRTGEKSGRAGVAAWKR